MPIKIALVTSKNLHNGSLKKDLPEIYDLKNVIENNAWHNHQDVFEHTVNVFKQLEILLMEDNLKPLIQKHLKKMVGKHTKKDLLIISALLHDIAKPYTAIKDKAGIVRCPGHEFIGSTMVKDFSKRFDFDKKDESYVKQIVFSHGIIVEAINQIMGSGNNNFYIEKFKEAVGDIYYELVLHFLADLLGSDLNKLNLKDFKIRKNIALGFLNN